MVRPRAHSANAARQASARDAVAEVGERERTMDERFAVRVHALDVDVAHLGLLLRREQQRVAAADLGGREVGRRLAHRGSRSRGFMLHRSSLEETARLGSLTALLWRCLKTDVVHVSSSSFGTEWFWLGVPPPEDAGRLVLGKQGNGGRQVWSKSL